MTPMENREDTNPPEQPAPPTLRLADDRPFAGGSPVAPPVVLHVRVVAGKGGGPDKTILRSAEHLNPSKLRVAAAYIHPNGDPGIATIREQARRHGCPLYEIAESGPVDPRTVRSLVQLCRKLRVTVWHGHDYKSNALGLLVRKLWPMKLITTVHGWTRETARTRLYYHVDNWCLPRYDHVITVSPPLYHHCLKLGIPRDKLSYIPNGVEVEEFRPAGIRDVVREELGVARDAMAMGVVGRFSVEKGVDRALRLLAALKPRYPRIELHLFGDGPERAALEGLAGGLGVTDAVRFHGWLADSRRAYEMMDVLLLPSHTEGLPNVVLEAMAMNVAVAATDVGGVRELLDGGRCGVILSQDESAWLRVIEPLLVSASRREELARQARARVEKHYTFAQRLAKEWKVYKHLLRLADRPAAAPTRRAA